MRVLHHNDANVVKKKNQPNFTLTLTYGPLPLYFVFLRVAGCYTKCFVIMNTAITEPARCHYDDFWHQIFVHM